MLADQQGKPLALSLTGGQEAEITQAPTLIARAEQVADNCDDVDALIELLHGRTGHP